MTRPPVDFFNEQAAKSYDDRNSKLTAISDCMHFLIGLTLKNLPVKARILCVGSGTGAEIITLARLYPEWTFVASDPSASMLKVCRERLEGTGIADRCEFIHGYVQDVPATENFDAVLSVLVGHFVKREERLAFYQNMVQRLKAGGYLVNTEISFDLDSAEFSSMLKNWESVQALMGGTPESLALLPQQLREMLTVLAPGETETWLRQSGIAMPVRFFQAFMICGWYGIKQSA